MSYQPMVSRHTREGSKPRQRVVNLPGATPVAASVRPVTRHTVGAFCAAPARPTDVRALQRMVGNRQVVRTLAGVAPSAAIQRGWLDDALETAGDLASTAGEAANDFGDKASDAWDSATNTAADVASDIGETAGNAWSAVSDAASDFGEEAGEVASEVGEEAGAAWD
ncbi:MAG: hypothetical protein ACRDJH_19265, partial [Thermomicrobiales bacterium]